VPTAVILPGEADTTSTSSVESGARVERTVRLHVKLGSCDRES